MRLLPLTISALVRSCATASAQVPTCAWLPLGQGILGDVRAFAVFDDGNGPGLYVGGRFAVAGGAPASRIARWDGSWSAPAGGVADTFGAHAGWVQGITSTDLGAGPELFIVGDFNTVDGYPTMNAATGWYGNHLPRSGPDDSLIGLDKGGGSGGHPLSCALRRRSS